MENNTQNKITTNEAEIFGHVITWKSEDEFCAKLRKSYSNRNKKQKL